jgi:PIN domain nuclease of toxin-antitoxin system
MKIIIDTHTFLWFINDSPELPNDLAELLESPIDVAISVGSLWEIAIKVGLNKLNIGDDYQAFIAYHLSANNIDILPITIQHLSIISQLPQHHKDPFDRLIIAQAIAENIPVISIDKKFDLYPIQRQWEQITLQDQSFIN